MTKNTTLTILITTRMKCRFKGDKMSYVPQKYNDDGTLNEDYLRYFSDDWRDELEYRAEIRREVEMLEKERENETF